MKIYKKENYILIVDGLDKQIEISLQILALYPLLRRLQQNNEPKIQINPFGI